MRHAGATGTGQRIRLDRSSGLPVNINSLLRCAAIVFTRYRRQGRERAGPSGVLRQAAANPYAGNGRREHRRRSRQRPCPVPKASPLKRTTEPTPKTPSSIRSKCIPASSASRRAVPRRARACSVFPGGRRPLAHGSGHGVAAWMRCGDGGLRSSRKAGRIGRGTSCRRNWDTYPLSGRRRSDGRRCTRKCRSSPPSRRAEDRRRNIRSWGAARAHPRST